MGRREVARERGPGEGSREGERSEGSDGLTEHGRVRERRGEWLGGGWEG